MKIIDSNGRLFGKVNLIDILALLLAILAVLFVFVKVKDDVVKDDEVYVEYKLLVVGVREQTYQALTKSKASIINTNSSSTQPIGDIVSFDKKNSRDIMLLTNGECLNVELVDKFDITVTVIAKCAVKNGFYYLPTGSQLLCGEAVAFSNGFCRTSGEVSAITQIDDIDAYYARQAESGAN